MQDFLQRHTGGGSAVKVPASIDRTNLSNLDQSTMSNNPDLFAEKFQKFTVRDYNNNTRMNIKNAEYAQRKIIRDRAIDYWQNNVI